MLPTINAVGKIVAEPELRFTPQGVALCKFRLVFSKRKKTDNGGWVDDKSIFLSGTLWDKYAEHAAESLNKGDTVLVSGSLYQRDWEDKEGNKRTSIELDIFDIGPTLKWGPVKIARAERSSGESWSAASDDPWASDDSAPF